MADATVDKSRRDQYLERARTLLSEERYEEAKGALLTVLDEDPECGMAYQGLFLVSVRTPTFERLTADFLIPTEDTISGYTLSEDPAGMYEDIEKCYAKYEVEHFLTKKDIDLAVGIGSRSIESTYREFIKKEKERFIKIWDEDSNIQKAYEYCTLEEQFNLSTYYERLIEKFDNSIFYYETQRKLQCFKAMEEAKVKLDKSHSRATELVSTLDSTVERAEKEIARGKCCEAYSLLYNYKCHPKARRTMDKAVAKKQKMTDFLSTGVAILFTAMYLIAAWLFSGVELDYWIFYPFFNILMFAVGYAGIFLFEKLYDKAALQCFQAEEKLKVKAFPKMIYTVLSAAGAVYFLNISSFTYLSWDDPELYATMLTVSLPIFFMTVATLINADELGKLAVSCAMLLAILVFTGFPFVLEFDELDVYGFAGSEEFYGNTVMPLLVALIYAVAVCIANAFDKKLTVLSQIAVLAFEIAATTLMVMSEGYPGTFIFCILCTIGGAIFSFIFFMARKDSPPAPKSSRPSILYCRIVQSFDYKSAPRRPSGVSNNNDGYNESYGGGYSGGGYSSGGYCNDDDDDSYSSSSGYDYGSAFSPSSDDNDTSYDSADYNARSLGFNDADSAADAYGISRNDLYW